MPLVSVIVPIYNVEKYIADCIESIVGQTYRELEIILVDDGTRDRSGVICDQYQGKDARIRVIHKENGGLSDARNTGIQEASGKYLLFVDGDDSIAPDCVQKTVECAESNQADVVIFDFQEIEEATGRMDVRSADLLKDAVLDSTKEPVLLTASPSACNKLYRRDLWVQTGLKFPLNRHYEDLSTIPKLLVHAKRVVYIDSEPLYNYVLREGSIMRSHNFEKSYRDRKAAIDDVTRYYKEQKLYEEYKEELEYIAFEHGFFVPSKEIIYYEPKSPYLKCFEEYIMRLYPKAYKNRYVKERLTSKDKIIFWFIKRKMYGAVRMLSTLRKQVDLIRKK